MKAREILEKLCEMDTTADYSNTCDTFKTGDPEHEVKKVAVSMFGTYKVISEAVMWGADFLIVHEPLFYNHWDKTEHLMNKPAYLKKQKLIDDNNLTICRMHDHTHNAKPDEIGIGEMNALGLAYTHTANPYHAVNRFELQDEITAGELLDRIKTVLGVKFARLVGSPDNKVKLISGCFGTPGHLEDEISVDGVDIVLCGEACEWATCEYVRDMSDMGMNKSMIVMGHCGSEREGMIRIASALAEDLAACGIEVKYFEAGEPYSK